MKRKKNGTFEKGNKGGPGRPELPKDLKEVRKLNQFELEFILNESLLMTPEQLKRVKDDPESTMLQLLVVSIITHGTNKGDQLRMGFLLDRLLGKMKENLHLEVRPHEGMTDEALAKRIEELERRKALPAGKSEALPV